MARALFIHGGALGDFVLGLRIVQCIHEQGFESVDLLTRGSHLDLVPMLERSPRGFDLDRGGFHTLFAKEPLLIERHVPLLREYSLIVSMVPAPSLSAFLSQTETKYMDLDPVADSTSKAHITEQWIARLPKAWRIPDFTQPLLLVTDELRLRGRELLKLCESDRVVIIHPGSGGRRKCYPLSSFLMLANKFSVSAISTVFVLGETERELFSLEEINTIKDSFPVLENLSLCELACALSAARACVGNDSGVSHLAAALGTPTVAIFGPTDPRVWKPLGPKLAVADSLRSPAGEIRWQHPQHIFETVRNLLSPC